MAASEWCRVRVADIAKRSATGPFGSAISSKHFCDAGIPVIRGSNLSQEVSTRLDDRGLVFVSEEKAAEFSRSEVQPGDLVFTCWGTIDQVGLIDDRAKYVRYIVSNKQMLLTPDSSRADSLFLYYVFASPAVRAEIINQGIGSSVPGFNLGQLRSFEIPLPPLSEQKAIAAVLGVLDDKIELNRRMNATLEAMARALFQSWFVDFDSVRAKLDGRKPAGLDPAITALFPADFQESAIRHIPKGWNIGIVGDLATLNRAGVNPGDFPEETFDHFSLPAFDNGRTPKAELGSAIMSNKFAVPQHSVLLSKLNPHIPRIWLPDIHPTRRSVCSTEFMVACTKPGISREYLFSLFTSSDFASVYGTLVTGTTGSHQRIRPESVLEMKVVIPPSPLIQAFTDVAKPIFDRINRNTEQSRALAILRDTLLPKLLSGEISVQPTELNA